MVAELSALRDRDRASIRSYLENNAHQLIPRGTGRVLDFGSGRQPYRDIIENIGEYEPFDRTAFPGSCAQSTTPPPEGFYDAAICTQVVQYLAEPEVELEYLRSYIRPGGLLLMTGPTNWPIVEKEDLWRFTPAGITLVLERAGWNDIVAEQREVFVAEGDARWPIGFQVRATA